MFGSNKDHLAVSSTKGATGNLFASSGSLAAAVTALTLKTVRTTTRNRCSTDIYNNGGFVVERNTTNN